MLRILLSGAAVGALMTVLAPAAQAQTATGATAPSETVQEVVVTAQRRSQSAQDVGIALTVLSSEDLTKQGINNVNQLQNASPSLEVEPAFGSGQPQFRIRGVGFQDYQANNAPTVGIYIDDVAYPIPVMTQGALFDISRVEVLRGPQGTLYGRNTTGGAVNFITNQPTKDFTAGIEIEAGNYDWLHAEAYVSGPLTKDITSRLAAVTEQGGGYEFNRTTGQGFGDADRYGLRWITDWTPTDRFTAKLDLHGFVDRSDGTGLYLFTAPAGIPLPADSNPFATGWGLGPTFAKDIGVSPNTPPFRHNVQDGVSLSLRYNLGFADLINLASYDFMNRREYDDWSATQYEDADVFFHTRSKVASDELRLVSNGAGPLSWIGGVYVSYQDQNSAFLSDFIDVYGISAGVHYDQKVGSEAVFGQAEYRITDQISVIGGLRYENETRSLDGFTSEYLFGTVPVASLPPSNTSSTMNPVTGKIELDYKPIHDFLFYAEVSKGVKSGGFTVNNTANVQSITPFKPEQLWDYEGGIKWTLAHNLRLNAAVFHYDYKDEQVLSIVYVPPTTPDAPPAEIGQFVNAPRSHIDGGELQLSGELFPRFSFNQQIGYKVGKYDRFPNYVSVVTGMADDQSGHDILFPKFSYEGDASYWLPVWAGYRLELEGNYSYRSYYPSWLGSTYNIPSYWLFNANLTLRPPHGPWSVALWARNLFDKRYDLTRNFFVPAVNVAEPAPPRTFGARLTYAFGS